MTLSIVIVNWNTRQLLEECLGSILKFGERVDYEIIVIDNASRDGSQKFLSGFNVDNSNFKVILNHQNLGFAKAVNQGMKASKGDYILLLNPDAQTKEKAFESLIGFMEKNKNCGIVGGKILNDDGSTQASVRGFPSFGSQFFILLKLHHFVKPKTIKNYFLTNFRYDQGQEVEQVMGAFFLIRRKVIEKIGYFDDKFFLWFEEVDFCYRTKKAGWKVFYHPEAETIHLGGASFSQKISFKNQWQFNKSLLYYFRKHHSFFSFFVLLTITPFSLFLSFVSSVFPFFQRFKKI